MGTVEVLLTTGEVARRIGLSSHRVRQLIDAGSIIPAFETSNGDRLFRPADVEAFAAYRAANPPANRRWRRAGAAAGREGERG